MKIYLIKCEGLRYHLPSPLHVVDKLKERAWPLIHLTTSYQLQYNTVIHNKSFVVGFIHGDVV